MPELFKSKQKRCQEGKKDRNTTRQNTNTIQILTFIHTLHLYYTLSFPFLLIFLLSPQMKIFLHLFSIFLKALHIRRNKRKTTLFQNLPLIDSNCWDLRGHQLYLRKKSWRAGAVLPGLVPAHRQWQCLCQVLHKDAASEGGQISARCE